MNQTPKIPHNAEAEQQLIGAVLLNNSGLLKVGAKLKAEHFYVDVHQRIWQSIIDASQSGIDVNPVTLKHKFEDDNDLESLGGSGYLLDLAESARMVVNLSNYANLIIGLYQKRQLREACLDSIDIISNDNEAEAESIAAKLIDQCSNVSDASSHRLFTTEKDIISSILDDIKNDDEDMLPISSGMPRLDEAMGGGFYPAKCYGFIGRKKMGKTMFACTLAHNLAMQDIKHLFICCEMGSREIYQRMLSRKTGIYESAFRNLSKHHAMVGNALASLEKETNNATIFSDKPNLVFSQLKSILYNAVTTRKIKCFILDYWQLVRSQSRISEREHLDHVAQWLASFCKDHKVVGIVLGQANQEGNTRGSEGLRLACDQAYLLDSHVTEDGTPSSSMRHLQMLETRYTPWQNIGTEAEPAYQLNEQGCYFEELEEPDYTTPIYSMMEG